MTTTPGAKPVYEIVFDAIVSAGGTDKEALHTAIRVDRETRGDVLTPGRQKRSWTIAPRGSGNISCPSCSRMFASKAAATSHFKIQHEGIESRPTPANNATQQAHPQGKK